MYVITTISVELSVFCPFVYGKGSKRSKHQPNRSNCRLQDKSRVHLPSIPMKCIKQPRSAITFSHKRLTSGSNSGCVNDCKGKGADGETGVEDGKEQGDQLSGRSTTSNIHDSDNSQGEHDHKSNECLHRERCGLEEIVIRNE